MRSISGVLWILVTLCFLGVFLSHFILDMVIRANAYSVAYGIVEGHKEGKALSVDYLWGLIANMGGVVQVLFWMKWGSLFGVIIGALGVIVHFRARSPSPQSPSDR